MLRFIVRRAVAIFLAVVVLVLGTGAVQYAHNHAHLDDGHANAAAPAERPHHPHDEDGSDETNCFLHALMRAPALSNGHVPLLVCLGLFVAFLTALASQPAAQRFLTRLDCRGPPSGLLISA